MMGKYTTGAGIAGSLKYLMDSGGINGKNVTLIDEQGFGLLGENQSHLCIDQELIDKILPDMVADFELQSSLNTRVTKPVRHVILSMSEKDRPRLDNEQWRSIVRDYMGRMGITNTQYAVFEHKEKNNPHIHLLFNAVDNDGNAFKDKFFKKNSNAVCREITRERGLCWGKDRVVSRANDIHSPWERQRYHLAHTVAEAVASSRNMDDLKFTLLQKGIVMQVVSHKDGGKGLKFTSKGEDGCLHTFSGSTLSHSLSYKGVSLWHDAMNKYDRHLALQSARRPHRKIVPAHFGAPDLIRLTSAILPSSNTGKATASAGRTSKSKEELMEEYIKENMIGNSNSLVDYSLTTSLQTTIK